MISVEKTAMYNPSITKRQKRIIDFLKQQQIYKITEIGSGRLRMTEKYVVNGIKCAIVETKKQIEKLYSCKTHTGKLLKQLALIGGISSIMDFQCFKDDKTMAKFITCSFVLCVIPNIEDRQDIVQTIRDHLSEGGYALFEVRGEPDINGIKNKEPFLDGYIVGNQTTKTFQIGYTEESLTQFIEEFGFIKTQVLDNDKVVSIIFRAI